MCFPKNEIGELNFINFQNLNLIFPTSNLAIKIYLVIIFNDF